MYKHIVFAPAKQLCPPESMTCTVSAALRYTACEQRCDQSALSSPSSGLSRRTLRRQVSPRIHWEFRTSGQRGPSLSPSTTRIRLRNKTLLAVFLCNTGLRNRGDIDYREQPMAHDGKPTPGIGSGSVTLTRFATQGTQRNFRGCK